MKLKSFVATVVALACVVMGICFYMDKKDTRMYNNGVCQICGEDVIPVGHMYHTDYYCLQCKTYNK